MTRTKLLMAFGATVAATTLGVVAATPAGADATAPSPGVQLQLKLKLPGIDPIGVTAAEYGLILAVV